MYIYTEQINTCRTILNLVEITKWVGRVITLAINLTINLRLT